MNRACEGCRGPSDDCNAESLAKVFHEELGLTKDDVVRKFRKYAGNTAIPEGAKFMSERKIYVGYVAREEGDGALDMLISAEED